MPTPWQVVEVPFRMGLNEKSAPEAIGQGEFTILQNARQNRDGALTKRPGTVQLSATRSDGSTRATGAKLWALGDAVCSADANGIADLYSPTGGKSNPVTSKLPLCTLRWEHAAAISGVGAVNNFSSAIANGYIVTVYCDANADIRVSVLNATTFERVRTDFTTGVAGGGATKTICKLVAIGSTVYFFQWDDSAASGAKLWYTTLDCTSIATIASGTAAIANVPNITDLIINGSGWTVYDIWVNATNIFIAYVNNSGGANSLTVRKYSTAVAQTNTVNVAAGATPHACAIGGGADIVWVAYDDTGGANAKVIGLAPSNLATTYTAATVITSDAGAPSIYGLSVIWTQTGQGHLQVSEGAGNGAAYWRRFTNSAGAVSTGSFTRYKAFEIMPLSRQILYNGRVYAAWMTIDLGGGNTLGQTVLVDINGEVGAAPGAMPVATFAPGLTDQYSQLNGEGVGFVYPAILSATKIAFPQLLRKVSQPATYGVGDSLTLFVADFAYSNQWQAAPIGETVALSAGSPYYFDGQEVREIGFVTIPTIASATAIAGGGLTNGASYTYKAIYEWVDAQGCTHWSAPSVASSAVVPGAGNNTARLTITQLQVTARLAGSVRIAVYRAKGAGVYQRVGFTTSLPGTIAAGHFVTFDDALSDAVVATNPVLYTDQNRQPRFAPANFLLLIPHQDRLVGVDGSAKNVWYSGQYVYGEAPWFTPIMQFPIDVGGPITALGSLHGRLFIFKRDRIYYVDGDGPGDAGGPGFSLPQEIPCGGAGCIEPRSVIATHLGLFYQSTQGIYLLTPGNEVQFVGRGVEQSLITYPLITSAALDEALGKVIFTATKSDASFGISLVYDYVHGTWSTDFYGVPGTGVAMASAATVSGAWYGLDGFGTIYQTRTSDYRDSSTWQTTKIQTGWLKLAGEQAYNRLRNVTLLAQNLSGHDLTIDLAYDYNASVIDTRTWTAAELAALVTTREQIGVSCSRQKVEAIQITITDASPSSGSIGTAQGANFLGLAFEVQPKSGTYRLPSANMK